MGTEQAPTPNVADLACVRCGRTTTHDRAPDGRMQCIRCRVIASMPQPAASTVQVINVTVNNADRGFSLGRVIVGVILVGLCLVVLALSATAR